jgi:hypothetical protein
LPDTNDLLRARFQELRADIEAIEAVSAPLRAARDGVMAKIAPLEKEAEALASQFIAAEEGLFDKKRELARLSRALDGKTAPSE